MTRHQNETVARFESSLPLIGSTGNCYVFLREKQPTLGCLVIAPLEAAALFGALSAPSVLGLQAAVSVCEKALRALFAPDRVNLLALQMVDPDFHFHLIPRYSGPRCFSGREFVDPAYGRPPALDQIVALEIGERLVLAETLRLAFQQEAAR